MRFHAAVVARSGVFREGTLSRVDARIPFAGICKTREIQSLRSGRLASALQSVCTYKKSQIKRARWERAEPHEHTDENQRYLRGYRYRCSAAAPRRTNPASRSTAMYPPNNQPEPSRAPPLPPLKGV